MKNAIYITICILLMVSCRSTKKMEESTDVVSVADVRFLDSIKTTISLSFDELDAWVVKDPPLLTTFALNDFNCELPSLLLFQSSAASQSFRKDTQSFLPIVPTGRGSKLRHNKKLTHGSRMVLPPSGEGWGGASHLIIRNGVLKKRELDEFNRAWRGRRKTDKNH